MLCKQLWWSSLINQMRWKARTPVFGVCSLDLLLLILDRVSNSNRWRSSVGIYIYRGSEDNLIYANSSS